MIDFVNTPPFLRIALQVAMATIHFHIAQTGFLWGFFFAFKGSQETIWPTIQNCPWGER